MTARLGYTVRMMIPLVVIPAEHRWGYLANAPFGLAEEWIGSMTRRIRRCRS